MRKLFTNDDTTQKHIDNEIERLEELTGLKLNDDKLSGLEYENHKLTSIRKDTSETDITQKRKYSKTQFYDIVNSMVRLLEEMQRQKTPQTAIGTIEAIYGEDKTN